MHGATKRRSEALTRLQGQLERGYKMSKDGKDQIPLSETDINRINNDVSILKSRL